MQDWVFRLGHGRKKHIIGTKKIVKLYQDISKKRSRFVMENGTKQGEYINDVKLYQQWKKSLNFVFSNYNFQLTLLTEIEYTVYQKQQSKPHHFTKLHKMETGWM